MSVAKCGMDEVYPGIINVAYDEETIDEVMREESEAAQALQLSYNPLIDLNLSPSKRINCDNPCQFLQTADSAHQVSLKRYQQELDTATELDKKHYENIKVPMIVQGTLAGLSFGMFGGSALSQLFTIAWRTTVVLTSTT